MQRAVSSWILERERRNFALDIEPARAVVAQAQSIVRDYLGAQNAQAREDALETMRGILNSITDVFAAGGPGLSQFLELLFRRAFHSSYARWQDLLLRLTAAAASTSSNQETVREWRREADALSDLLRLPLDYFGNAWATLIPDITQQRPSTRLGTREPILGPAKGRAKVATRRKTTPEAQQATVERAQAEERERQARVVQQQVADPFPVTETYRESAVPDPSVYVTAQYQTNRVYKTGDDELWAMAPTLISLDGQPLPSVSEFWMLKHEAGFWIEEYLNVTMASCDFSTPAILDSESIFRRYIVFNLLKLALAATNAVPSAYQGALALPLLTNTQWREYMATEFPLTSIVLFQETPASGQGAEVKQQLDATAAQSRQFQYLLQALGYVQRYFVVAQPPLVQDDFPLTTALQVTLGTYCGDLNAFVPCCKGVVELRYSDFQRLLGMAHGGELNDEVINQFMKPILSNADTAARFLFLSSFLPELLRRGRNPRLALEPGTTKIVIPINLRSVHWYLLVADLERQRFEAYDSISPHEQDDANVSLVASWLDGATENRYNFQTWPVQAMVRRTLQPDIVSCGVYTCMFAQVLLENRGLVILDQPVAYLRSLMCEQLLNGAMISLAEFVD